MMLLLKIFWLTWRRYGTLVLLARLDQMISDASLLYGHKAFPQSRHAQWVLRHLPSGLVQHMWYTACHATGLSPAVEYYSIRGGFR